MPEQPRLAKATLQEIRWINGGKGVEFVGSAFDVQFNPQTLKVTYTNQSAGGDAAQGAPVQYVGRGTTKLTVELWFDTTVTERPGGPSDRNVQDLTARVNYFMHPKPTRVRDKSGKPLFVPPGLQFHWGSFSFDGVLDSMDETLEFFSDQGIPLRASVSISMSRQEIPLRTPTDGQIGTQPLEPVRRGDSVQQMAARGGQPDWQAVAQANGIENPRLLVPGTLLNVSVGASIGTGGGRVSASGTLA